MTVLYQVWVPAVAVAHLIGLSLLVYSLEKVSGIVSKTASRISCTCSRRRRAAPTNDSPYIDTRDIENGQVLLQSCLKSNCMLQYVHAERTLSAPALPYLSAGGRGGPK